MENLKSSGRDLKLQAARALKIAPTELDAGNPFDPASTSKHDRLISEWIRLNHPKEASDLIQQAGVKLSLAAQAVADGTEPMSGEVWAELKEKDPGWVAQQRSAAEARMAANLEQQAEQFIEASRKKRQALHDRGPNISTGPHNNEFLKRIGGLPGLNRPARDVFRR